MWVLILLTPDSREQEKDTTLEVVSSHSLPVVVAYGFSTEVLGVSEEELVWGG